MLDGDASSLEALTIHDDGAILPSVFDVTGLAAASVGVATLPDVAASAEELVRAADMAMYQVKDSGKNGVRIALAG